MPVCCSNFMNDRLAVVGERQHHKLPRNSRIGGIRSTRRSATRSNSRICIASSSTAQARYRPSGLHTALRPAGLQHAEEHCRRAVPDDNVARSVGDDAAAVGGDEDLLDDAIPALGRQRLSGGRVPAVDGPVHGAGQRFAAVREVQVAGPSGRCAAVLRRSSRRTRRSESPAAATVLPSGEKATLPRVAGGRRPSGTPSAPCRCPHRRAGGRRLACQGGQRFPVGRKRQLPDAVALLSVHEAAKLLAGFHVPEPGEVVVLVVVVTAARHQLAVRREGDAADAARGRSCGEIADRLAALEVDQVNDLPVGDGGDGLAVRRESEHISSLHGFGAGSVDRAEFLPVAASRTYRCSPA